MKQYYYYMKFLKVRSKLIKSEPGLNTFKNILSGWTVQMDLLDSNFKPYVIRKLELSTQDGVILWGNRVIVPPPGQDAMLQELHACHPGIGQMKTLARMFVWWSCLDTEIENYVNTVHPVIPIVQPNVQPLPHLQYILRNGLLNLGSDYIWTWQAHFLVTLF